MKIITILLIGFILFNVLMIVKSTYGQNTNLTQEQREYIELHKNEIINKIFDKINEQNTTMSFKIPDHINNQTKWVK